MKYLVVPTEVPNLGVIYLPKVDILILMPKYLLAEELRVGLSSILHKWLSLVVLKEGKRWQQSSAIPFFLNPETTRPLQVVEITTNEGAYGIPYHVCLEHGSFDVALRKCKSLQEFVLSYATIQKEWDDEDARYCRA